MSTLSSSAISLENDDIAGACCSSGTSKGKTRRDMRQLFCLPRNRNRIDPAQEPAAMKPKVRLPEGAECKEDKKPYCCDKFGQLIQNKFGNHREYCFPCEKTLFVDLLRWPSWGWQVEFGELIMVSQIRPRKDARICSRRWWRV